MELHAFALEGRDLSGCCHLRHNSAILDGRGGPVQIKRCAIVGWLGIRNVALLSPFGTALLGPLSTPNASIRLGGERPDCGHGLRPSCCRTEANAEP